jgi:L-amino acid N-acyltransferase YncA
VAELNLESQEGPSREKKSEAAQEESAARGESNTRTPLSDAEKKKTQSLTLKCVWAISKSRTQSPYAVSRGVGVGWGVFSKFEATHTHTHTHTRSKAQRGSVRDFKVTHKEQRERQRQRERRLLLFALVLETSWCSPS